MNDLQTRVVTLCCFGALATLSACSTTTSSAQGNDSTAAVTVVTDPGNPRETTTTQSRSRPPSLRTTVPVTDATDIGPKTTVPEATVPETIVPDTVPVNTLPVNLQVIGPSPVSLVGVGKQDGPDTAAAQRRLTELGFWVGDADGHYGFATTQAVMAFQKYLGLDPTGQLDQDTASWLTVFPERARSTADDGTLVEVDKAKQLLFIIQDGKTLWTFNTSTGSGEAYSARNRNTGEIETGDAVTPNGLWRTNRERPNGWWEGDLGDIYRPKYFRGGVAIHGMTRVPNYPASHGCVRLSTAAMDFIWDNDLIPLGTPVWVHE